MPYIETAEHTFFYTFNRFQTGSIAKSVLPLVLLHGAGGTHLDWPPELRLWPHGPVYAVDLPGHGRSAPPGCSSVPAYAAAVRTFLAQLALPQMALMGHSMGGAIAQQLALQPPLGLAALILVGTGAKLRVAPEFLIGLGQDFSGTVSKISNYLWSAGVPPQVREESAARMKDLPMEVVRGDFYACDQFDIRQDLALIKVPTLVISGSADQMTPLKFGQFLVKELPEARMVTISGAGHMTAQEQPAVVATAVYQYLQELGP